MLAVGRCLALLALALPLLGDAAPRKQHVVSLGAVKKVPYSKPGDPAGAQSGEDALRLRPLLVDGVLKEWTTGDAHDVTDRSFVIRRALRLNDALPADASVRPAPARWVWQRGPWLLVDRSSGHVLIVHLPDYDPAVSQLSWFRDYAGYCGVTASGKSLQAVVAQIAARKPVLSRKIVAYDAAVADVATLCPPPVWQREPLRITYHVAGREPLSFDLVPGSAVLAEPGPDDEEPR